MSPTGGDATVREQHRPRFLTEMRTRLQGEVRTLTDGHGVVAMVREASTSTTGDWYDRAQESQGVDVVFHVANGVAEQARDKGAALDRLRGGTYGFCVNPACGAKIPEQRLRAVPEAKFCTPCGDTHERAASATRRRR